MQPLTASQRLTWYPWAAGPGGAELTCTLRRAQGPRALPAPPYGRLRASPGDQRPQSKGRGRRAGQICRERCQRSHGDGSISGGFAQAYRRRSGYRNTERGASVGNFALLLFKTSTGADMLQSLGPCAVTRCRVENTIESTWARISFLKTACAIFCSPFEEVYIIVRSSSGSIGGCGALIAIVVIDGGFCHDSREDGRAVGVWVDGYPAGRPRGREKARATES
jgi:hypothetical protein